MIVCGKNQGLQLSPPGELPAAIITEIIRLLSEIFPLVFVSQTWTFLYEFS